MPIKPVNIVCVFKINKFKNKDKIIEYNPIHVQWLKNMVEEHVCAPHRFICLSDHGEIDRVCERIPLKHNWPGWWSKMELYRPGLFDGPVFYIDLDTVILDNIDDMLIPVHESYFMVLKNLCRGYGFGSGLMAWEGDFSELYRIFLQCPDKYIKKFISSAHWGDQGFLQVYLEGTAYWQDYYPKAVVSYYFDMFKKGIKQPPKGARIICAQGLPKPWDIKEEWVPTLIKYLL